MSDTLDLFFLTYICTASSLQRIRKRKLLFLSRVMEMEAGRMGGWMRYEMTPERVEGEWHIIHRLTMMHGDIEVVSGRLI